MPHVTVSRDIGGRTLTIETGLLAKQAAGAALVRYGDTCVFAACVSDKPRAGIDFFPLQVDYREKLTAGGKFPGGFFKREGRPTNKEILTARLIDRPTRPLFPEGYNDDLQVHVVVHSCDEENDPDILGMVAASAALHVSPLPWLGPTGAVRVGLVDGTPVLNPTPAQLETSDLSLVVAGTAEHITMVEASASEVSEPQMLEALQFAHRAIKEIVGAINELAQKTGRQKVTFTPPAHDRALLDRVKAAHYADLLARIQTPIKFQRRDKLSEWKKAVKAAFARPDLAGDAATAHAVELSHAIATLLEQGFRELIVKGVRCDGRRLDAVRPIECRIGLFPRTHGSALFTRGETQALVSCTLGSVDDEQRIDGLFSEYREKFMLHYNFPSYSVGETKPIRGPGRREIGHGALASRAVQAVLPDHESFPYTIRIVSEITESNGSSSMATICGSSLSLMAAGVPTASAVAGVAMGLISEEATGRTAILTDILGIEDHLGDMDFKVGGTREGITALQMDIKIKGLKFSLVREALAQAREARLFILDQMDAVIAAPRPEISPYAPRIFTIKIHKDRVRDVIGPGGKVIRGIVEETGAQIDVEDDGTIFVASADEASARRAIEIIRELTQDAEPGKIYYGTVRKLMDFGAFVEIFPGTDGLVHISNIAKRRIGQVSDVLKEGDRILVKCLDVEGNGRIRLSMKDVVEAELPEEFKPHYHPVT